MDELPKMYIEEMPESQKRSKLAIGLIVLVLLAMPVGIFLTLRQQNLRSNADSTEATVPAKTAIILQTPQQAINNQTIFPVDVVLHTDNETANLFSAHLNFPIDKLEVISIAKTAPDLNDQNKEYPAQKWIDASFDNQKGIINLAAGMPIPGLKTSPQQTEKSFILATVFFKSKSAGDAAITLQPGSMILKEADASNILTEADSLNLQIRDSIGDFADKKYATQANSLLSTATTSATLSLESPNGGEVFSYYKPILINWANLPTTPSAKLRTSNSIQTAMNTLTISLFLNNEFLGQLATDVDRSIGEYLWNPSQTLTTSYAKPENSFKIELSSEINGSTEQLTSNGPFAIYLTNTTVGKQLTSQELTKDKTDFNQDGVVDYKDISWLFTQYLQPVTVNNKKADLNNDVIINDIDLWYLLQAMNLK